jgi:hypothetical protein
MSAGDQIMLGKSRGELPVFSCHCGPQLIDGRVQYLTHNEDEASGRVPVQTSSVGDYPGPVDMGFERIGMDGNCSDTYQRTSDSLKLSG